MALLTSVPLNTITTSPIIVPTALLPLTHQCDTSTIFLIVTDRTKEGFLLSLADQFEVLRK